MFIRKKLFDHNANWHEIEICKLVLVVENFVDICPLIFDSFHLWNPVDFAAD